MLKNIIKCAIEKQSGVAIHIDRAQNGLKCGCYCTVCGKDFVAIQGKHREWHFRHEGDDDNSNTCPGGVETALHKLAKQILVSSPEIVLPTYGTIPYDNAVAESKFERLRPDVSAVYKNEPIYFEVAVRHFVDFAKEQYFINGEHRSVEINLSRLDPLASHATIENAVLRERKNKRIIFWETKKEIDIIPIKITEPEPSLAVPVQPVSMRTVVLPVERATNGWNKVVNFVKRRPLEALGLFILAVITVLRIRRWIARKLF